MAALTVRAVLVLVAWWVFAEGDPSAWAYGAAVVVLTVVIWTAASATPSLRLRPLGVAHFFVVFARGVVRGGVDVARRALSPRLPITPDWLIHETQLREDTPQRLLMMAVSVMPGTFAVDREGTKLRLHVLSTEADPAAQVQALEKSIAHAFGQTLEEA